MEDTVSNIMRVILIMRMKIMRIINLKLLKKFKNSLRSILMPH